MLLLADGERFTIARKIRARLHNAILVNLLRILERTHRPTLKHHVRRSANGLTGSRQAGK
jgi:hypothetical protein